jgi:membrane-associated phospholipid phosphatase
VRGPLLVIALCFAVAAPAAAQTADASVGGLFVDLWHDLPRLVLPSNLVILGAGGTGAIAIEGSDPRLVHSAVKSEELGELFRGGSYPGSGWFQITGAVGTYVAGRVSGNAKVLAIGNDLVQAQILNTVLTSGVKFAAHRTRPDGGHNSFPSGHTSSSFASAAVLARHFGWKVKIPAYGLATYVATARVQENHHYVSDVVFGAALGLVSGRTVTVGKGATQFQVVPAVVSGGAGVFLTRTAGR